MPPISSIHNARIKQIRALRSRRVREQTGLFFVEGLRVVAEAVQLGAGIELLVITPELLASQLGRDIVASQQRAGVPCLEVTPEVLESLGAKAVGPGIGAVVRQRWESLDHIHLADGRCWVALDTVQYPGNLGTILRTSDAAGGAGVILLGQTTDPHDPAATRASMGAIFSQRLVRTSLDQFVAWKHRHNALVVGTSPAASTDYRAVPYRPPLVLLMGSEAWGLSPEMQALCDVMVKIPMVGRSDSLNLAVATGVMLYEIFHQQRALIHAQP